MMKWYISFWFWLINLFRFWLKRRAIIFVIFFSSFFHFGFHVLCSCSFWTKWMSLSWMTFGSGGFANFTPSKMFYSLNKHSDIVLSSEGINSVLGKKILGTITVPFINHYLFPKLMPHTLAFAKDGIVEINFSEHKVFSFFKNSVTWSIRAFLLVVHLLVPFPGLFIVSAVDVLPFGRFLCLVVFRSYAVCRFDLVVLVRFLTISRSSCHFAFRIHLQENLFQL